MASINQTRRRKTATSLNPYRRKPPAPPKQTACRISMAWWLTLPLASLVLASSLLVGGLILGQSKQTTNDIAQQLEQEISDRTLIQLKAWIEQPKAINRLNQAAFSRQNLSLDAPDQVSQHFLTQLQAFPSLHQLIAADSQGRSVSLRHEPLSGYRLQHVSPGPTTTGSAQFVAEATNSREAQVTETFLLDATGKLIQTLPVVTGADSQSDLRQTDWFQTAQADSKPIWVKDFDRGEAIAARPVQSETPADAFGIAAAPSGSQAANSTAIVSTVLDLYQMGQFLNQLKLPDQAQVFVIDESGLLLSTSTDEATDLRDRQGNWSNRQVSESQDPITQAAAKHVIPRWTGTFPNEPQPFRFKLEGETIRGQMLSYKPYDGAHWLITVALPEASLLGSIRAQQLQLLILCLGLLLLSLLLCRWLAQWITRPLRQLTHATQTLGQGHWQPELFDELASQRKDELGELARSFRWMSRYLQDSFHQLEGQKQQLQRRNQTLKDEKARLKDLDRFKDEFLATTTQELRIPLSGILGLAESLQAQTLHPSNGYEDQNPAANAYSDRSSSDLSQQESSRQAAIELIIFSARRLTTLVNDLLDLSKAKHNSLKLSCSGIELHRVAQHVLALCAPLAAPKKLRLVNNIPPAFPLAYGDSHRVQQIFYHLVSNAIKFTPDGEVTLSAEIVIPDEAERVAVQKKSAKPDPQIAAHRAAQNAGKSDAAPIRHIAITISDTGVGLKPELRAQLAQVFQQPSDEAKHHYGGKGLGLTIVQTFVELHGGRIEARSHQDYAQSPLAQSQSAPGSAFCFTLPILESVAVRPSRSKSKLASSLALSKFDAYTTQPQLQDQHYASQGQNNRRNTTAIQPPPGADEQSAGSGHNAVNSDFEEIHSTFVQRTAVQPPENESAAHTSPPLEDVARSAVRLAETQTRRHTTGVSFLPSNGKPKARILVIDDDAINLEVLMRQLALDNYQVVSATNGEEALKLLDPTWGSECFDLVILEVMMPRMSGYDVCRRLREDYPSYQLPVIMLTAKVQVQDVVQGFRAGANDYLRKPFSSDELRSRIQTHLTNRLYGRFVPAHFLKFLRKSSIAEIHLGNQVSRDMTVLFSDIRSFATLSEAMSPQENFDFINSYFQCVSPEVRRHQGFIVKYLGDGMMAIFPQSATDAVAAGIAQLKRIRQANQHQHLNQEESSEAGDLDAISTGQHFARGNQVGVNATSVTLSGTQDYPTLPPIQVGIGIHYGPMTVGIVGEAQRMQGDVFSDDVNLTARLEGLTKFYGVSILISEQVLRQLDPDHAFHIRLLDKVQVKGRNQPLPIYEVFDGDEAEHRDRKIQTRLHFEAGVHCYQAGKFVAAQGHFRAVAAADPQDRPAKLYCRRVARLIAKPPGSAWTGISAWGRK